VLTEYAGWEWVFLLNVPIGVVLLAMTALRLVESSDPNPPRIDVPGQLTLVGGLFGLVYGLLNAAEDGWGEPAVVAALVAGVGLLVAVVAIEARSSHPMVPLGMFRDRRFAGAQVAALAISAGLFSTFIYIMIYLQELRGYSPIEAGLFLVPGTMCNLFAAAATAQLGRRVPPVALIAGGLALVTVGMVISAFTITADASWLQLQTGLVLAMIGTGLFNPAVSEAALDVPQHQAGLATGIHDTARQTGIAVGIAALGTLISSTDYVGSLQTLFLVGGAIGGVGAIAALLCFRGPRAEVAVAEPATA
jgi:predicted MFS family arabinose efflux permease